PSRCERSRLQHPGHRRGHRPRALPRQRRRGGRARPRAHARYRRHRRPARQPQPGRARQRLLDHEAVAVSEPAALDELTTPAAIVDLPRMAANLDRLAAWTERHGLALRPHIKTHKSPELAREQLRRGAAGLTVATLREAEVMSEVADDILIAYP